jgi:predicted nucleic acid-binding protein
MLLVDTSAWVEVFRKPARLDLADVGGLDEVVTCLPVIQEVLQGFREERAFRIARDAMLALPCVESPLGVERFEEAAGLYRAARRAGVTVRSTVDCLIAACALRHGLTVLHRDRDFAALARISPLLEQNLST